jgi:hypothetical protein
VDCSIDHSKIVGLRFCTGCGTPLNSSAAAQTPYVPPAPVSQSVPTASYPTPEDSFSYTPTISAPDNTKRNSFIAIGAGVGLLALIGIFATITAKPDPVSVDASLTIIDQNCYNLGWGYFDIPGAQVTLTVDGVVEGYAAFPRYGTNTVLGCKFTGYFTDIPADGETYSYSLASGRRGVVTRTLSEMQANDWAFDLTLG